jgi:hypothetical protein
MEKKYTIKELCDLWEDLVNDNEIGSLQTISYYSYQNKILVCDEIIRQSMFVNKRYRPNSPYFNLLFVMKLIDIYTCIKIDYDNIFNEYDLLTASGIIDFLFSKDGVIPINEQERFQDLLEMQLGDFNERRNAK